MKISIEEIKGLNITGYIDFLEKKLIDIQMATTAYPYYAESRYNLALNVWGWHSYFIQKGDFNNYWYGIYSEIAKKKEIDLEKKLEATENDLFDIMHFINETHKNILLQDNDETMIKKCLKMAKIVDFRDFRVKAETYKHLFETSLQYDKDEIIKKMRFNEYAMKDKIKELEETDFKFAEYVKNGGFCSIYFYDSSVSMEFATLEFYKWIVNYNNQKQPLYKPTKTLNKTQFAELLKALFEAGALRFETEKQGVEALALALNVEIDKTEFDKILQKIKGRNADTETKFLDTLTLDLKNWINKS